MDSVTADAWSPREIAARVESIGVAKARTDTLGLLVLSILAGAFISLGALLSLVVLTNSALGFGVTRLLGGIGFSLGLVLVVVAGAELFTGNNLVSMAWASRLIRASELLRNWALVYVGNVLGALGTVALVKVGRVGALADGAVRETVLAIGHAKAGLDIAQAVSLGILCNALVCLAVWLSFGGRSVTDKIVGVVFPVTAFVAIGFEHSIANWFLLPYAFALGAGETSSFLRGAFCNLAAVTAGNILGGTFLVAGVYWVAYLRPAKRNP